VSYTLARFEPTIFCSVGGDDDHYVHTPRRQSIQDSFFKNTKSRQNFWAAFFCAKTRLGDKLGDFLQSRLVALLSPPALNNPIFEWTVPNC
jgi:hypothetical protein